ncbi:MAG: PAS domain S-box protein [Candidatus Xenobiia bacterium LiM19]
MDIKKLLIVEDDMIAAAVESQTLRQLGYEVITAGSAQEAINKIDTDRSIDLVLMDIDLGIGMNGPDAAKQILARRRVPIIFLTSHSEQELMENVRGITRYGYVIKNSGDFVLKSSIEMAFELFNAHESLEKKNEEFIEEALQRSGAQVREKLSAITDPQGDTGALDLVDIIDSEALQLLMDDLYRITGISSAIIDIRGRILVASQWQDICTKFHRIHPDTKKHCEESDICLASGISPGSHRIYRCMNNMWDMATPIMAGGVHMGNLFVGQLLFDDEETDYDLFRAQARRYGFDEKEYMDALARVPRKSREQLETVMKFCTRLADMISSLSYSNSCTSREAAQKEKLLSEIRQREEDFSQLFEAQSDAILIVDNETGRILQVNNAASALYGYSVEELLTMRNVDLSAESEATKQVSQIMPAEPGFEFTIPLRYYRKKDGTVFPVEIKARFFVKNGRHVHIAAIRDITERVLIEEKIRKSEEHYRMLTESMIDVVWILDIESGRFRYVSPSVQKLRGYTAEEVMAAPYEQSLTKQSYKHMLELNSELLEQFLLSGKDTSSFHVADVEQPCRDGTTVWTELAACYYRNEETGRIEIRGVARDITKRRKAEEALRRSEALLNAIQRLIGIGGWEWDIDTQNMFWTEETYRIHDWDPGEIEAGASEHIASSVECYAPEYRQVITAAFQRCAQEGEPYDLEFPFTTRKGRGLWIRTTAKPVLDNKRITRVIGTIEDITERKLAQEALEKSEKRFQRLISIIPIPIYLVNKDGAVTYSNDRFTQVLGYSLDDIPTLKEWWLRAYPDESYRRYAMKTWEAAVEKAAREDTDIEANEYNVTCGDGSVRVVVISGHMIDDGFLATFVDITERKRFEEALQESEKRHRSLFQNMLDSYTYCRMLYDEHDRPVDFVYLDVNSAFERLTGLKDPLGKKVTELIPGIMNENPELFEICSRVISTGTPERFEIYLKALSLYLSVSVYCPKKGHFVAVFDNITERKQMEKALTFLAQYGNPKLNQGFFEALACYLAENLEMNFVCIDRLLGDGLTAQTVAVWCDGRFEDNVTYALKDTPCGDVVGKRVCCFPASVCQFFPNDVVLQELKAESYIGVTLWSHTGTPIGLIAVIGRHPLVNRSLAEAILKTVTVRAGAEMERMDAEERIKGLLAEKELLLQEVHHRIKNNMNTMIGLLSLQARKMENPTAAGALMEARSRLRSMGVLYDKLYRSENLNEVSMKDYLRSLINDIAGIFPDSESLKIETRIDDFVLPVRVVSPLGIIVNELLTNAMKYAFTDRDECIIAVTAQCRDNHVTLVFEDNGNGIPESVDIHTSGGFGLMLVGMLVEQLNGSIRIERNGGTAFILEFQV